MGMKFFERRKVLKKLNSLDMTPIRLFGEEVDDSGIATIIVPKFTSKFSKHFFMPMLKRREMKIKLDKYGSASWLLMDGERNIEEITKLLQEKFGEQMDEAQERLLKFITLLYETGYVTFAELNPKGE